MPTPRPPRPPRPDAGSPAAARRPHADGAGLRSVARRAGSALTVALLASGGLIAGGPSAGAVVGATAAPASTAPAAMTASSPVTLDPGAKLAPRLQRATGPVTAFVRTAGVGALSVDAAAKGGRLDGRARSAAATARVQEVTATTDAVMARVTALEPAARRLYATAYTVPGVAIVAAPATFRELAKRADVVSIVPVVTKHLVRPVAAPAGGSTPANTSSDIMTGAIQAWNTTGHTGKGVNVAVIDTGLDYTHADFGGPGTSAAYRAAFASTAAPQADWYDATKYLGGADFAGGSYDAARDPFPQPDANPLDGPGGLHGTHVSGTVAGFGVSADGTTFRGDPTTVDAEQLRTFSVGPGTAPGAGLYALKVFGDYGGSTNLTGAALDWVGQALTEGKRIDVVNMSLGSDYGAADDPDNAKVDALTERGVLSVVAEGNAGDSTDVGGSPGNSASALSVAAVDSGYGLVDGLAVTAPTDLAAGSPYLGKLSVGYYLLPDEVVSGQVSTLSEAGNLSGCGAFSDADRARARGKVVWLEWDDTDPLCGSAARFQNAEDAGAVGVLLPGSADVLPLTIAGNYTLPGMQLTLSSTNALRPAAEAGTLAVSIRGDLVGIRTVLDEKVADTIAPFSSRGDHGSYGGIVKPDVSAPGVNVVSARAASGNQSLTFSGTSMATPVTAGIAALTKSTHPGWDAVALKAGVMNTAGHDVTQDGTVLDNLRQGAGRVDALAATRNEVTLSSRENGDLLTASFGVMEVASPVTATRTVVVTNRGTTPRTYTAAYRSRVAQPGVTVALDRGRVTVAPGASASLTLRLRIADPGALRRVINPTQSPTEAGAARDFVAAVSGLVVLTPMAGSPADVPALRLPVFAAPKPVGAMRTVGAAFASPSATTAPLTQTGRPLAQGSGEQAYTGSVVPLVLGATSPVKEFPAGPSQQSLTGLDLLQVGAASTAPHQADPSKGLLVFGLRSRGPLANPGGNSYPAVYLDVNRDGRDDFQVVALKLSGSDVTVSATFDLANGAVVDVRPFNANTTGTYVNTFDSSVAVLTVSLSRLGFVRGTRATTISYQARTESRYAPGAATTGDYTVDAAPRAQLDVFDPPLWFTQRGGRAGDVRLADTASGVTVHRRAGAPSASVLALHLGNAVAQQAQVVPTR